MEQITKRQRFVLRALVVVAILMLLGIFGVLGRNPPVVY